MAQSEHGEIRVWDDFLAPDNDLTWGTGTVKVGNVGFVSVNEGSFEWTIDEPGGIVAVTTDTADNDNGAFIAGTFRPADGTIVTEVRFKFSNVDCAIFAGFSETMALDTPVMPAEFATATMTYNGTGGMMGAQYDVDGTDDDFRAVAGDGGVAVGGSGNGTRANQTITADEWYIVRTIVYTNGGGEVWVGHDGDALELVKTFASGTLTPGDKFYAVLMIENRSGNARVLEVDYFEAKASRDWTN